MNTSNNDPFVFMPNEYKGLEWKQATYQYQNIDGWMVSENGLFYRPGNGEIRMGHDNVRGIDRHKRISLNNKQYYVARIVAEAFVPNENPMLNRVVRHLNDDPDNNHYTNLKWGTHAENTHDGILNEKIVYDEHRNYTRCEDHPGALLTNDQVIEICKRLKNGERVNDIAKDFQVGRSNIWHIYSGSSWRPISKDFMPFPESCIKQSKISNEIKVKIMREIIRNPSIMPSTIIEKLHLVDNAAIRSFIGEIKREIQKSIRLND